MIEDSVGQHAEPNQASTVSRKGKSAVDFFSLISAVFTIIAFMKDSMEVVSFMLEHVVLSILVSAALVAIFAFGLAPRAGAPAGATLVEFGSRIRQLMRLKAGRRVFSLSRRIIVLGALTLVLLALFKVYISGVYYILLESGPEEGLVAARVTELNGLLAQGQVDIQVELTPPLGGSKYHAITIGPMFDESEATATFVRLQEILGHEIRPDAGVKKVTLRNLWKKATGVFGIASVPNRCHAFTRGREAANKRPVSPAPGDARPARPDAQSNRDFTQSLRVQWKSGLSHLAAAGCGLPEACLPANT